MFTPAVCTNIYTVRSFCREGEFLNRWEQVLSQLNRTGSYDLTREELEFGAKLGWRNHTRCVARIQWNNLVSFFFVL